ncbi:DUF2382 domain-containing protein [uncultured Deinococcus sp.]|uniref:DUF2382 domain-containing protein n=1 Tax=uncultured Deinococcus sp. TaxID=158789 RepID=UPI0025F75885|nr:DUF2382 domain-containing protein [uncultured Deinococcus sp.]
MSDDAGAEHTPPRQIIELREERLTVEKRRAVYAQATVSRERRVREETVRLELVTEVLVITAHAGAPGVQVDGVALAPGETREIVLYQERALPGKDVVVTQEVTLTTQRDIQVTMTPVELAYEELVVNHIETKGEDDDRTE